jgi:hypothetical protein
MIKFGQKPSNIPQKSDYFSKMAKKDKAPKAKKADAAQDAEAVEAPSTWVCAECNFEHEAEDAAATSCVACGAERPAAEPADDPEDRYAHMVGECRLIVAYRRVWCFRSCD